MALPAVFGDQTCSNQKVYRHRDIAQCWCFPQQHVACLKTQEERGSEVQRVCSPELQSSFGVTRQLCNVLLCSKMSSSNDEWELEESMFDSDRVTRVQGWSI